VFNRSPPTVTRKLSGVFVRFCAPLAKSMNIQKQLVGPCGNTQKTNPKNIKIFVADTNLKY
jgi:hypothetical protein